MKKIILLFFIGISLYGCLPLEELTFVPREERIFGIDFSKYAHQGFLITPEKYIGSYDAIGLITYEYLPAAEYKNEGLKLKVFYDSKYDNSSPTKEYKIWVYEHVKIEQVMDSVYKITKNMGADALVNFAIREKSEPIGSNSKNPSTRSGYIISGFAIKRK